MRILGIETSCDETAVAVIEVAPRRARGEEITVLSNVISSQIKLHAKYGGVVPNLAAREHVKNIGHVFKLALKKAVENGKWKMENGKLPIDLIAVTRGPGLGPSLLVGIAFARTLAWKYNKPLIGVNHLEGHIFSNWLTNSRSSKLEILNSKQSQNSKFKILDLKFFPVLNLIVSGGHTELVLMTGHGKYKIIGETLDDAVGEAFDKVARLLGLGYPGGPIISQQAEKWKLKTLNSKSETNSKFKIQNSKPPQIEFPRPMINSKNYNFSYAGLKTSVLYKVRDLEKAGVKLTDKIKNEVCYEFQKAALGVLILKTKKAAQEYKVKSLFLSGGVSANKELRKRLAAEAKKLQINYSQPAMEYTTDNAAMIAMAGYFSAKGGSASGGNYVKYPSPHKATKSKEKSQDLTWESVEMDANLEF